MSTLEQVKPTPVRPPEGGGGPLSGARNFVTEVRNEMRRVTWPSRKEVYATTFVVIATSAFFGIYLWGLDVALSAAVQWIFSGFGG